VENSYRFLKQISCNKAPENQPSPGAFSTRIIIATSATQELGSPIYLMALFWGFYSKGLSNFLCSTVSNFYVRFELPADGER
jgi:hypothetical protein